MADNVWGRFNVTSIIEVLTQEGNLSREKFGSLMASYASSNRRDYDITGTIKGHTVINNFVKYLVFCICINE
jgi:hypothetical protein